MSMFGHCQADVHTGLHPWTTRCKNWVPQDAGDPMKKLPIRVSEVVIEQAPDHHVYCNQRILALQQELGAAETKYAQLQQIYNKLADQWNVFQATNRPDNRNIQRAEGAGEMARKLAEVLLGIAYSTDVRDLLRKLLDDMDGAGGQEVEAYSSGRLPNAKWLTPGVCPRCGDLASRCHCG